MSDVENNPSGADQTRSRLIQAGLEVFAQYGLEGATTRMLCSRAGVNLAAIGYHFGGKEGLYRAVVGHIAQVVHSNIHGADERIERLLQNDQATDEDFLAALEGQLLAAARFIAGSPEANLFGPIIVREQTRPTPAFEIIYEAVFKVQFAYADALVARLLKLEPGDPEVKLRTHALFGQVLVFRAARATLLHRMNWQDVGPEDLEQICQAIMKNVRACLGR